MQYDSRAPIYLQVIDHIQKRLVQKEIRPGDKLPSTRMLAMEYEVNPNTAVRIYKEMEMMGLCHTERGLGTYVTDDPNVINQMRHDMACKLIREFVREMSALGFSNSEMKQAIEEEIKLCNV